MKVKEFRFMIAGLLAVFILSSCTTPFLQSYPPQYYAPLSNAEYVSTGATIAVRYGPELSDQNFAGLVFIVEGDKSGLHTGKSILADDHKTVIFQPNTPFTAGEQVQIKISGLRLGRSRYQSLSYTFNVAANQQAGSPGSSEGGLPDKSPRSAFSGFLTLPQDIPHYTVKTGSPNSGEGCIFVAPFYWTKSTIGSYLLILNEKGQIVYYKSVADDLSAFDFKEQPNGMLSYFSQQDSTYYLMDSHYQVVDSYKAGNGYTADLHDFQILPNGNALLMAYDAQTVDMSSVVDGGKKDATATGLIIQELDPSHNVIFEWRSWDHFSFADFDLQPDRKQYRFSPWKCAGAGERWQPVALQSESK